MRPGFEVRGADDFERRPAGHGAGRSGAALDFEARKARAEQMTAEGAANARAVKREQANRSTNVYRRALLTSPGIETRTPKPAPVKRAKGKPDLDHYRARAWASGSRGRGHGC